LRQKKPGRYRRTRPEQGEQSKQSDLLVWWDKSQP